MLAHLDDSFETPRYIIEDILKKTRLTLDLDVCATDLNTKCFRFFTEEQDALTLSWNISKHKKPYTVFCNPPRSLNGKFVKKTVKEWQDNNLNIIFLLTWNDLGNKYGQPLVKFWKQSKIHIENLGEVFFDKNGIKSQFPSRLTYCWIWFKRK